MVSGVPLSIKLQNDHGNNQETGYRLVVGPQTSAA
jgi:hypothetical protein